MGYRDGLRAGASQAQLAATPEFTELAYVDTKPRRKRKLSAWNKFVKANSKKPRFKYRDGKLNLKKLGVAFRKTPAGKKKRR